MLISGDKLRDSWSEKSGHITPKEKVPPPETFFHSALAIRIHMVWPINVTLV